MATPVWCEGVSDRPVHMGLMFAPSVVHGPGVSTVLVLCSFQHPVRDYSYALFKWKSYKWNGFKYKPGQKATNCSNAHLWWIADSLLWSSGATDQARQDWGDEQACRVGIGSEGDLQVEVWKRWAVVLVPPFIFLLGGSPNYWRLMMVFSGTLLLRFTNVITHPDQVYVQ